MTDIPQIAARLSEAQRDMLMFVPEENPWLNEYSKPEWPRFHMRADLGDLGMMRPNAVFNHAWRLSAKGLAVAQYLRNQDHG